MKNMIMKKGTNSVLEITFPVKFKIFKRPETCYNKNSVSLSQHSLKFLNPSFDFIDRILLDSLIL